MDTAVSGAPRLLLRLEGIVVLTTALVAYDALGYSWRLLAVLLLVPDLAIAGYAAGPRAGAIAYNAAHTYLAPATLAALGYAGLVPDVWPLCLIWMAHIGMDRALGLGLKFGSAFNRTHLGIVGGATASRPEPVEAR